MGKTFTSLFLTTYNWPGALELCLHSILDQSVLPDEIIIADDGSSGSTAKMVEKFKQRSTVPIKHCWQEDKGYRINAVRNLALKSAGHPYIIQIDGDVILHKHFVRDHLQFAKPGRLLVGRRLTVNKAHTNLLLERRKSAGLKNFRNRLLCWGHQHLLYNDTSVRGLRGCNISYWKEDAYNVNGYDEEMVGKGPDDKDFGARMVNLGVKVFNLKFYASCFHLFHGEEGLVTDYEKVKRIYERTLESGKIVCKQGINQL